MKRAGRGKSNRREFLWMTAAGMTTLAELTKDSRAQDADRAPVRCAVAGVGVRGREILTALSRIPFARVTAFCDVYEPYLRRGARLAPQARPFPGFEEMLRENPEIQAVFIATPTHLHREPVTAALQAGKAVYCEAPLAATLEDCRAIARAVKSSQSAFASGLQNRFNPVYEHASKFLRARATGTPVADLGHWYENNSWRRSVSDPKFERAMNWKIDADLSLGLPGEAGVHTFDNSLRYRQDYPSAVSAVGSIMKWDDGRKLPDTVFCVVEYGQGFITRFEATLTNSFRQRYYLQTGTEGTIWIEDARSWWFKEADAQSLGWEVYASREKIGNEEGIVLLANATKLLQRGLNPSQHREEAAGTERDPLSLAVRSFLESVSSGTPPVCGLEEGFAAAVLAIKAAEALRTRQRVALNKSLFEVQ